MKKFLSLLLSSAILAMSLCACDPAVDDVPKDETESATGAETTPHGIPEELDFGGSGFNIAYMRNDNDKMLDLYYVEEYSSDNMAAAVFSRNTKTEQYLNVDINAFSTITYEELRTLFQSGDDIYQHYVLSGQNNSTYLIDGLLYNIDMLPYIDLDADWWNKEVTDSLRMGKYTYLMVSDYLITDPLCMYFNRNMITDNNLEDPYAMVKAGTWTTDKVMDMAIAVRNDKDGDNSYYGDDDIVGIFTGDTYIYTGFMTGAARFMTERDENNRVVSNFANEMTYSLLNKIYRLYENPGSYRSTILPEHKADRDTAGSAGDFANGHALFTLGMINQLETMATLDGFTAGVVPFPKFTEDQDRYYSLDWTGALAVPSTIKNKELVGAVIEYLAWESGNEVVPTYYNKLLKTRYSADPETREMLELIFDTVYLEVGITYLLFTGFTGCTYICNMPLTGSTSYAAFFRVDKKDVKDSLEDFYAGLDAIELQEEASMNP
ncbi:MAG: hypothetical protein IJ325_13035 [Clostridia bacterium]|nr:hypothetical protein [Clostridia bacterium]